MSIKPIVLPMGGMPQREVPFSDNTESEATGQPVAVDIPLRLIPHTSSLWSQFPLLAQAQVMTLDPVPVIPEGSFDLDDAKNAVTQGKYPRARRASFMRDFAAIHNNKVSATAVKIGMLTLFETARTSEDPDIFYAGIEGVVFLKNADMQKKYLFTYLRHYAAGDAIGMDQDIAVHYQTLVSKYLKQTGLDIELATLHVEDETIAEALKQLATTVPNLEDLSLKQLAMLILIQIANGNPGLVDGSTKTLLEIVLKDETSREDRVWMMKALAQIYNGEKTSPRLKQAILQISEKIRVSEKGEPFYAGFFASRYLKGEGQGEMVKYLLTYVKYRTDQHAVAQTSGMDQVHTSAVNLYVKSQQEIAPALTSQDAEAALQRYAKRLDMQKINDITALELIAGLMIEIIPQAPARAEEIAKAIAQILVSSAEGKESKLTVMQNIAAIQASAQTTGEQRLAIATLFEEVAGGNNLAAFYAGMASAPTLTAEAPGIQAVYFRKFAEHVGAEDAIGQDSDIRSLAGEKAIREYAKSNAPLVYPIVQDYTKAWYQQTNDPILFAGLMALSTVDAQTVIPAPAPAPVKGGETPPPPAAPKMIAIAKAVDTAIAVGFKKLPEDADRETATSDITRHLDDVSEVSPLHAKWINILATQYPLEIKRAVLTGLRDVHSTEVTEKIVLKTYFTLIEDKKLRSTAIDQGINFHRLPDLAVAYLTDSDDEVRDGSHKFLRDREPIGPGKDPPIVAYGIERIEAVEKVRDEAQKDKHIAPGVVAQCQTTINILYKEWRKHHSQVAITLEGIPANSFNQRFAEIPMERTGPGLLLDGAYLTAAGDSGWRRLMGGRFQRGDGLVSLAGRFGVASEFSDQLTFSLSAVGGYLRLFGANDDHPGEVAVDVLKPNPAKEGYDVRPKETSMVFHGGMLALRPDIAYTFSRKQLGGGRFLDWRLVAGFETGLFAGGLSDKGCSYTATAGGAVGKGLCRSNDLTFGTLLGANLGIGTSF